MSAAREALAQWMSIYVGDHDRPALSKLVAAYVAECVRLDREKIAQRAKTERELREKLGTLAERIEDLTGKRQPNFADSLRNLYERGR